MKSTKLLPTQTKEPQLLILLLLSSFASVSAVLFTPALPEMTKYFGISMARGQLSMTAFLIGYALGNLPYGPLSNRYGRKTTIYIGILLAIFGLALILIAGIYHQFWLLIFGRFLAALGSCVGLKITFTIIGDSYTQTQATKIISYMMLSFAIAPGIAIAMGGFLTNHFGWESCFYFLTAYSISLLALSFFLPETGGERDQEALNLSKIKSGFLQKFRNKKLVVCACIMGCATSFVYLFASEAPFIGIEQIGLRVDEYGVLNFIPPFGMIIGSFFAYQLAGKRDGLFIIVLGVVLALVFSVVMLIFFLFHKVNFWSLFSPMPFIYIGLSLIFPNASGLAMSHAKDKSNASAVMNFINMGVSVISLLVIEALPLQHVYVLPFSFIFLGLLMLILWLIFPRLSTPSQIA